MKKIIVILSSLIVFNAQAQSVGTRKVAPVAKKPALSRTTAKRWNLVKSPQSDALLKKQKQLQTQYQAVRKQQQAARNVKAKNAYKAQLASLLAQLKKVNAQLQQLGKVQQVKQIQRPRI